MGGGIAGPTEVKEGAAESETSGGDGRGATGSDTSGGVGRGAVGSGSSPGRLDWTLSKPLEAWAERARSRLSLA